MFDFSGTGACFNTQDGSNSCYYEDEKKQLLFLIDCGESTFDAMLQRGILNNKKYIDILITHMHSDHVGSLSSLIFYCQFVLKIRPTIIYPENFSLDCYLTLLGNDPKSYVIVSPKEYYRFHIQSIKQNHSDFIAAFGYYLEINNKKIYYSGDSHSIDSEILTMLNNGNLDYFYQDVTKYINSAHMNQETLGELVLPKRREIVTCMHFDDDETKERAEELGFKLAKVMK